MRLSGHTLWYEGAAHDERGIVIRPFGFRGGRGRGKCSCGALSDNLESGAARKRWHRAHKVELGER